MPSYSYQCSTCKHYWDESRKVNNRHDESPCPQCGFVGDHKIMDAPGFKVIGGCSPQSFSYNLDKNMEKAKQMRYEHESKFGKYSEYTHGAPGSRMVIDPERDVTIHGDVGASKKEHQDIIKRTGQTHD